jgi:hypothetical protein
MPLLTHLFGKHMISTMTTHGPGPRVKLALNIPYIDVDWEKPSDWSSRGAALGGALGTGAGLGTAAMLMPGVRRSFTRWLGNRLPEGAGRLRKALQGNVPVSDFDPESLRPYARQLADSFREQGINPAEASIGVAGASGSGKSVFSKLLAEELGMAPVEMDSITAGSVIPRNAIAEWFATRPPQPGKIYEQIRSFGEVNPDFYDAIVHLERPVDEVMQGMMERGRGAWQVDIKDLPRVQQLVREGFDRTMGDAIEVAPGIRGKVRPRETGFMSDEMLDMALKDADAPSRYLGRDRWSKLQKLVAPRRPALPGHWSEWSGTVVPTGMVGMGAGGAAGAGTGYAAGKAYEEAQKPDPIGDFMSMFK